MNERDIDAIYAKCRAAFDADLGTPSSDPWTQLQGRLCAWQSREYGVANPALMALGVVEELGELAEASTGEALDDAIADVTIYACQLATCYRLDLGELVRGCHVSFDICPPDGWRGLANSRDALEAAGRLCHVVLKSQQGIRGMGDKETARKAVCEALLPVLAICLEHSLECSKGCAADAYLENVTQVAEVVMKRVKSTLPKVER